MLTWLLPGCRAESEMRGSVTGVRQRLCWTGGMLAGIHRGLEEMGAAVNEINNELTRSMFAGCIATDKPSLTQFHFPGVQSRDPI